jgi:AsmA family protein
MSVRGRTILLRTVIALAALIAVIVLTLALIDLDALKHPIERIASQRTGRRIVIAGHLHGHLLSLSPRITLDGLTVGNPPWEQGPPLLAVAHLEVQLRLLPLLRGRVVIERLGLSQPQAYLHRDKDGRANWSFESTKPTEARAPAPTRLPVVRNLLVRDGHLTLDDALLHLTVGATVQAREQASADDPHAFRLDGRGSVNRQPLTVAATGGPLLAVDPTRPYPFVVQLSAGDIRLEADGIVRKPFDLGRVGLVLRASGKDMADLYYLTQLAFPNTPPFELTASLERDGDDLRVESASGRVGASDLAARLDIDLARKRPRMTGEITSRRLRLADLAASLGTKASSAQSAPDTQSLSRRESSARRPPAAPANAPASAQLFPTARLQAERVRAMNADVRFRASAVEAGNVPLQGVDFRVRLEDGVLTLDPLELQMPQGKVHGTVRIDARGATPDTHMDLRVTDIQLAQFKGKAAGAVPPVSGTVQARLVAQGRGDSVHAFAAGANGNATFVLPHGEISAALAELTGVDLVNGIGLLLQKDRRSEIRCGVAQFGVDNGTMHAQTLLIDTKNVLITGDGEVRLGPEELALSIRGEPKKMRLGRLRTPVRITGYLLKPRVGIDTGRTLKQGAIAAAIGALVAPVAAVLAFVDPGLAKDANCAALLNEAEHTPGAPSAH